MKLQKIIIRQKGAFRVLKFPFTFILSILVLGITNMLFAVQPLSSDENTLNDKKSVAKISVVDIETDLAVEKWMTDIQNNNWVTDEEHIQLIENWMIEPEEYQWCNSDAEEPTVNTEQWMLEPNNWLRSGGA